MEIKFRGEVITLIKRKYSNGRIALTSIDREGIPYATFTTNLIYENIDENQAFIDTNNIPDAETELKKTGIISDNPLRYAQSGYCSYPLYDINISIL